MTQLLVTGCRRSGTRWLADCLTAAGVPCGHEQIFTPAGEKDVFWAAESSWCAAPYTPMAAVYVVHLVRHPLDVIRSCIDSNRMGIRWDRKRGRPFISDWAQWACRFCPGMDLTHDPVDAWGTYWVQWNRLPLANMLLRLEDVDAETVTRLARIVDPEAPGVTTLPPPSNTTEPARRSPRLTWEDAEHVPGLLTMAECVGYGP